MEHFAPKTFFRMQESFGIGESHLKKVHILCCMYDDSLYVAHI